MKRHATGIVVAVLPMLLAHSACHNETAKPAAVASEPAKGEAATGEQRAISDLDRPVAELFAESCEHGIKTFECDECRYSVGVVKAPAQLFKDGLLKTAKAERKPLEIAIKLTGEIKLDESKVVHLNPRVDGIIRKIGVGLGQRVVAGQPLVELESSDLGDAESAYLEALATVRLTQRRYEREAELRKQQISSEQEFFAARQEHEAAEIRQRSAREKLVRLGVAETEVAALDQHPLDSSLGRLVVRAPSAGTVLALDAVPGEEARRETTLAIIGDATSLWLWADLYDRDLAEVTDHKARGDLRALVAVRAYPKQTFAGKVDLIDPRMDEATRTVKLRVALTNADGKLRPGMFADVQLLLPGDEQALVVPAAAVVGDEGRNFVFVAHHDDYFLRRPVELGRAAGDQVEIRSGLQGGETLVSDGCFLLKSDVLRSKMGAGCAD